MKERLITGSVLALILLAAFMLGNHALFALMALALVIASYEVYQSQKGRVAPIMLAIYILLVFGGLFVPFESYLIFYAGILLLFFLLAIIFPWYRLEDVTYSLTMVSLLVLVGQAMDKLLSVDRLLFLYVLVASFASDIFAYFGGRKFGRRKLIERLSPNKTVEGAIIGYVASFLISFLFAYVFLLNFLDLNVLLVSSLLIPVFSQVGDLSFSFIKRHYGIKDFGKIFPGHGGVLDRIDSVIFAVIAFHVIIAIMT